MLGEVEYHLDPNASDERSFLAAGLMQQHGLVSTRPNVYTWSNQRGSESKIDFVLTCSPSGELLSQAVHINTDFLLGCDHRAVSASFRSSGLPESRPPRNKRLPNRCGQWRVDGAKLLHDAADLAERLELQGKDFTVQELEQLSNSVSYRPKSYRFKDPPHVKDMIARRKLLHGNEARARTREGYSSRSGDC